jgi:hypothetical protein
MIDDFEELRTVLAMRADLAPDPDDLIRTTRKLAQRRQIRRRGAALGGVVVLTVLALIGTSMLGRTHERPAKPVPPVPVGGPLIPPVFPFTVGALPYGLQPADWTSVGSDLTTQPLAADSMDFTSAHDQISVQWRDADPALVDDPTDTTVGPTPYIVHGQVVRVRHGQSTDHYWDLSWPVTDRNWIEIIAGGDAHSQIREQDMATIANAVDIAPSAPLATLAIPHVPVGFTAFSWQHGVSSSQPGSGYDEVEFCPRVMPHSSDESRCFRVDTGHGTFDPADYIPLTGVNSNAVVVHRQIDGDRWVQIVAPPASGLSAATLDYLMRETTFN